MQGAAPVPKRYRGMPFRCASGEFTRNEEPTFEALLAEPIIRLVMANRVLARLFNDATKLLGVPAVQHHRPLDHAPGVNRALTMVEQL